MKYHHFRFLSHRTIDEIGLFETTIAIQVRGSVLIIKKISNSDGLIINFTIHSMGCLDSTSNQNLRSITQRLLTCDNQSSFRSTQTGLSSQTMLGSALVALVSILGSNLLDVQFSRRQYQVFSIYRNDNLVRIGLESIWIRKISMQPTPG